MKIAIISSKVVATEQRLDPYFLLGGGSGTNEELRRARLGLKRATRRLALSIQSQREARRACLRLQNQGLLKPICGIEPVAKLKNRRLKP